MLWWFILFSLLASGVGLVAKRPVWLVVGAVLAVPLSLYLGFFWIIGFFLLPLPQLLAAWFVRQDRLIPAWLMMAPVTALVVRLGLVVISQ